MESLCDNPWLHWVTLYTDAGWHPVSGGTYGCRTRHSFPPFRTEISGVLPGCADNNVAEMHAIVAGVKHIFATWPRVDGIGVNTDSQTAQSVLKFQAPRHRRADFHALQESLWAAIKAKEEEQGSAVRFRIKWVKGHQAQRDGNVRGWLNNRVDALARKARA